MTEIQADLIDRPCSRDGCDRLATPKTQLCQRHYDADRQAKVPISEDKVVYRRARQRAQAALIKAHPVEFERLMKEALQQARAEAVQLRQHAVSSAPVVSAPAIAARTTRPTDVTSTPAINRPTTLAPPAIVKLRPGPKAGDDLVTRIDVGNCPSCARHHDAGHECPRCHTDLTEWHAAPDDASRLAVLHRMRCTRCGVDGTERAADCLPPDGRRRAQHDYELQAATG